ncbi:hypothetical protein B0H16DRAFT_1711966 [Mycena metata]|uniref:Uncharacterized protein n=1 Tax=Mycena metata TaxID=1033252 RepID=A0AAD7NX14_9AGAR|nr:hypothetical protein B0H16DRAFT_1711966 [Mycena metata]
MRLMDPDAWKVEQAPAIVEGVDLLKNHRVHSDLGTLDCGGRVAAHVVMGNTSYFITTNTHYVPRLPEVDPKQILIRRDIEKFCHLPAIPKAPTHPQDHLAVMWWNPTPDDFVCPASGMTLTRGLGRIRGARFSKFSVRTHALIKEYEQYVKSLPTGTKPPLLLPQLVQRLQLSLERLRMPSTYVRMVVGVTTVQREYLELTGLLRYMTKYRPRLDLIDPADTTQPDDCVGCFTDDPRIAQILWKVCLPCWLIRPLKAFTDECILKMVVPFAATDFLEMNPAAGFAPVLATDRLDDRLSLLHCTENTPWYRNPFEGHVASTAAAGGPGVGLAGGQSARAHSSRGASSSVSLRGRGSPYAAARTESKARKEKGPGPKLARDKFLPFDRPEMPTTISLWASALAAVDRSRPPSCGADLPQLYVMPEPALLASPDDPARRRMLYHHYTLLRYALMFRLGDGDEPHALLTTQQWRDIVQGKITKQGKAGSHAQARSASLEELLRPAFSACSMDDLTGFPVSPDAVPPLDVNRTKELLWELAEINFRYEFLVLDARASGLNRPDECRTCFASPRLIGMEFNESQRGFAARETDELLPHLLCMAGFMRDWSVPCERPKEIDNAKGRTQWSADSIHGLENAVTKYYTASFYELFGRAAVVPMRLDSSHTFSSAV